MELANLQNQINELKNQANVDKIYPIGSIFMSVKNENPSSLFGGTWEAWGSGRVPVGIDTTQTEFVSVEKTGGEKTHTLTIDEMPSHNHNFSTSWGSNFNTGVLVNNGLQSYYGGIQGTLINGTISISGGSQPHNNLQPYITCYMWKRID